MIQGAIFDFDGPLFDSDYVWETAGERFLRSIGMEPKANLQSEIRTVSLYQSGRPGAPLSAAIQK